MEEPRMNWGRQYNILNKYNGQKNYSVRCNGQIDRKEMKEHKKGDYCRLFGNPKMRVWWVSA